MSVAARQQIAAKLRGRKSSITPAGKQRMLQGLRTYNEARVKTKRIPTPAIYGIFNKATGMAYVGSSKDVVKRWSHWLDFLNGAGSQRQFANPKGTKQLHKDWNTFGEENFAFVVLENLPDPKSPDRWVRKQYWMDYFPFKYNLAKAGLGGSGVTRSAKFRKHLSQINTGKKHSEEAKRKVSITSTGRKHTPETRAKMSAIRMGIVFSPETRAKMSAARIGIKMSAETRKRMSEGQKARWAKR